MMYIFAFARELTLGFSLIKKASTDTVLGMVSSVGPFLLPLYFILHVTVKETNKKGQIIQLH